MSKTDAARRKSRKHIVDDLKRRLKNAKRRAVYWSGRPSFQGYGFVPGNRSRSKLGHPDLEYEVAMNDIDSLCTELEQLTGKQFKRTDPRQEYRLAFAGLEKRR